MHAAITSGLFYGFRGSSLMVVRLARREPFPWLFLCFFVWRWGQAGFKLDVAEDDLELPN